MSFEHNPADDVQPTKEEWELMELRNELDALQAKLDAVRSMCLRRMNASVTTGVQLFAGELLSVIDKEARDG